MFVTRDRLQRALLLAHSLTAGAVRRGWNVQPYTKEGHGSHPGIAIVVGEHRYPIEVHEETETLPFTQQEIDAWRNEYTWDRERRAHEMPPVQHKRKKATGRLRLVLPTGYGGGRAMWTDSPRSLNDALDQIFQVLEQRVIADDLAAEHARRQREEWERQERIRVERARMARIEEARLARATAEIAAWRQSQELVKYAAALRRRIPDLESAERTRIEAWCDWLEDRALRSDPTQQTSLVVGLQDERDGRGW
ncbi:hypothetical protein [Conexibacter arvalis]|uniref:Uncharacterized protein n=1 Tax=Conexibacter arvalis TaxID=912552 RepID=A0A840IBS4_9ACTN|nr:hypothetical protein [Conexibacter arvalis]MBB4661785.1 hypothetical protein [Conexibacter arvalis]